MKTLNPSAAPGGTQPSREQLQPATAAPGKFPKLQKGNDKEVAAELGRLVRDAQDGTRRILICGLFIETIVANLKRGQFGPWVESHQSEIGVKYSSICGWRQLAEEVLKQVGFENSNALEFSVPAHEFLALPASEVPEDCREVRAKIDELIAGKSVKQLMFQFREGEVFEDKLIRTGRGGNRAASRGPRRTNLEISRDDFEFSARVILPRAKEVLTKLLTLEGPHPKANDPIPRAWDLLDDKQLADLKGMAIDLRDGILESERRRAQLRPRK
jgi:hypothetical protein